jgi:hypothetical protein
MHDMQELVPALDLAATNKAHYPNESVEYRAARNALIVEEIELRRHLERVASQRRAMPSGGEIPQDFLLVLVDAGKGGRAGGRRVLNAGGQSIEITWVLRIRC